MAYKLGVVGLGHWFEMIHHGLSKNNAIALKKVVGVRSFEQKERELSNLGITKNNYFAMGKDPFHIPDKFFSGLDVIQISNPNKYHSEQTKQALQKGKYVVTEKTFATNKKDFDKFIKFIKENNYENNVYLHLHYVHKLLTLNLSDILAKITPEHGKVKRFSGTFFEEANESDRKRSAWIFSLDSGGIFMDWVHPYEILFFGAKAQAVKLIDVNNFIVNKEYDSKNPTGVETFLTANGKNFCEDAKGAIRISKGLPHETTLKQFIFTMESGAKLHLNFVGSQLEFNSENRGNWQLSIDNKDSCKVVDYGVPKGPVTSELLVGDIIKLCQGKGPYIKLDDVTRIFEPQWQYQEMMKTKKNITSQKAIDNFMYDGFTGKVE